MGIFFIVIISLFLFLLYLHLCPELTIIPGTVQFVAGDLYSLSLSNPGDTDKYSASFVAEIKPAIYSEDFTVRLPKESRHNLNQQPYGSEAFPQLSDVFGIKGKYADGKPVFIFYVQHLKAHESREVDLKFNGPYRGKVLPEVNTAVFAYSKRYLPINKSGDTVAYPIAVVRPVLAEGIVECTSGDVDCTIRRFPVVSLPPECYWTSATPLFSGFVPTTLPFRENWSCIKESKTW
jgi:hypothetical protein